MILKKSDTGLIVGIIENFLKKEDSMNEMITKEGIERLIEIRSQYASEVIFNALDKKFIEMDKARFYEQIKPSFPQLT